MSLVAIEVAGASRLWPGVCLFVCLCVCLFVCLFVASVTLGSRWGTGFVPPRLTFQNGRKTCWPLMAIGATAQSCKMSILLHEAKSSN